MIKRLLVLAAAALLLAGCVLQSRTPLYDDKLAELALGDKGGPAKLWNRDKGSWVAEKDKVEINVRGRHYEAVSEGSTIVLRFVKISGSTYVMQAEETGKPAVYLLAEVKGAAAEVRPLACKDMKADAQFSKWISYEGDDCYIKPGAPAATLFAALAKLPGEASSRMEISAP